MKANIWICIVLGIVFSPYILFAQPTVASHTILENNGTYGKLEFGIALQNLPSGVNVYDEDEIRIVIELTDPSQDIFLAEAFFYQPFEFRDATLCPECDRKGNVTQDNDGATDGETGSIEHQRQNETRNILQLEFLDPVSTQYPWRVRFAPKIAGSWSYRIHLFYNGLAINVSDFTAFNVEEKRNPGFITTYPNPRDGEKEQKIGFVRETGESYFPTGGNLTFYPEPYCRSIWDDLYVGSVNQLGDFKGNYARLLMSADEWRTQYNNGFIFSMEGGIRVPGQVNPGDGLLGNYDGRQNFAFLLDRLITQGNERNVNFQLCLMTYNELRRPDPDLGGWGANAENVFDHSVYSTIPSLSSRSLDFYADATAKKMFKRKLRYILSRWGYATNVFGWELLAEVDLTPGCDSDPSPATNQIKVDMYNWISEMSVYMKNMDPNHLIAISRGNDAHNDFNGSLSFYNGYPWLTELSQLPTIDLTQNHTYATVNCYSGLHHDRVRVLGLKNASGKPSFSGEFGEITSNQLGGLEYDRLDVLSFDNIDRHYYKSEVHNNIWASSFSGADGTAAYWQFVMFDNPLPEAWHNGQVRHIEPLRKLLDQIDFANTKLQPITSRGDVTSSTLSALGMPATHQSFFNVANAGTSYQMFAAPSDANFEGQIEIWQPTTTQESIADRILAFGLKSDWNIYGWFQKRDNWWYNLPHMLHPAPASFFNNGCAWGATPVMCNASTIQSTSNDYVKAEFKDVCEGEYVIDYYSAYPSRSIIPNGSRFFNGGEIPSFKRRLFTTDRALGVKLPRFEPLTSESSPGVTSIFAPDYGYKISKIEAENYQSAFIGQFVPWENVDLAGDIETFNRLPNVNKVFFKGANDGLMHQHYFDPGTYQWVHGMMNNSQGPNEKIDGNMAAEHGQENKIFYRGTDGRMHHYYFVFGTGWIHDCLPAGCSSPAADNIDVVSEIAATDNQVFYKGASDQKMQLYYFDNNQWNHAFLSNGVNGEKLIKGDIKIPEGVYTNTDIVFYVNENDELSLYSRNSGSASSPWTYRVLNTSLPLTSGQKPVGNICPAYLNLTGLPTDNYLYCFYIGFDGDVHCLVNYSIQAPNQPYPVNSVWEHFSLNVANQQHEKANILAELYFDVNSDKKVLYYWGADNHMHRYYWDYHEWSHSAIVPCGTHNFPTSDNGALAADFRLTANNFIYKGADLRIRTIWNAKNCEKCTPTYQYRKAGDQEIPGIKEQREQEEYEKKLEFANDEIFITVFPNPCTDKLTVICDHRKARNMKAVLASSYGSSIMSMEISSGERKTIDVSELARGLYFLQFFDHEGKMLSSQKISVN